LDLLYSGPGVRYSQDTEAGGSKLVFLPTLEDLLSAWRCLAVVPAITNRGVRKLSRGLSVAIGARALQPTELPISEAVVSIIRPCDLFATLQRVTVDHVLL